MTIKRDCYSVQTLRVYMVYIPEPREKVIVISNDRETVTLNAALVHPITKRVYSHEALERFNPVTLVQSGDPHWYWIVDRDGCSCNQKHCTHKQKIVLQ